MIDREQFLAAAARPRRFQNVTIPGLGEVRIRSLRERERSKFEAMNLDENGKPNLERLLDAKRRLIVMSVVDAEGSPILTAEDVDALADLDSGIVSRLCDEISKHSGITATDLEALSGNSDATDGDDSR